MKQWAAYLGLVFAAGVAGAGEDGSYAGEVTASRLNLRAGPGDAFQAVHRVDRGVRLIVRGPHPSRADWLRVEVPGGFKAWVYARFVAKRKDGGGILTGDRVMIRPRPTTLYHQLDGRLARGEKLRIVGMKKTEEGDWYQVVVPSRFWLYASASYIRNIGPVSLAVAKAKAAGSAPAKVRTRSDRQFILVEPDIRVRLGKARTMDDLAPLRRALKEIKRDDLSLANRERRVSLLADINEAERRITIDDLTRREGIVNADLERKLKQIERDYQRRMLEIQKESTKSRRPRYVTSGIVRWRPDLVGRWPEYRIEEGGKMRYFLIAPDYDLSKFKGKRVGVTGLTDPESGTGYSTIMVRRIEILGNK